MATPACGNATLALLLVPLLGLPPDLLSLTAPLFVLCGSLPTPGQKLSCLPDEAAHDAYVEVSAATIGDPLPVDNRLAGPVIELVLVLQDELPPPADTAGLADLAVGTLECRPVSDSLDPGTVPPDLSQPDPPTDNLTMDTPRENLAAEAPVDLIDAPAQRLGSAPAGETPAPQVAPPQTEGPTVAALQPITFGYAYPIAQAFPLAVIAVFWLMGRTLTRPVGVSD